MEYLRATMISFCVILITLAFMFIYVMLTMCNGEDTHENMYNIRRNKNIKNIDFRKNTYTYGKPVYCLMVTGKDSDRYKFAKVSVINFLLQTYRNKYLLILNHGEEEVYTGNDKRIKEIRVYKGNQTLGGLRNISLNYVPDGAIFTTWDDDDWRSDDYLEVLYNVLVKTNSEVVMLKNRISYNLNNNTTWKERLNSGFVHFFMYKDPFIKYSNLDTLEDQAVKKYVHRHKRVYVYDNDPKMYIRNIHKNNTSPYVIRNKTTINKMFYGDYTELELQPWDKEYAFMIYNKYYSF